MLQEWVAQAVDQDQYLDPWAILILESAVAPHPRGVLPQAGVACVHSRVFPDGIATPGATTLAA